MLISSLNLEKALEVECVSLVSFIMKFLSLLSTFISVNANFGWRYGLTINIIHFY